MDYKNTLNLPKTDFPMKADLPKREPSLVARWRDEKLYEQIQSLRKDAPPFIFHLGPPFANGDAHIGHVLTFTLKDIVAKSRNMAGLRVPLIPGWDCHGLPIEHKVMVENKDKADDAVLIREKCAEMAQKYIAIQKEQFRRLGVIADWDQPYITMEPSYEADELRSFAKIVGKGFVYAGLRPVYWSTGCQTALAEAEIEYQQKTDPAVYVKFPLTQESVLKLGVPENTALLIWTTTPWTLPANLAVAVSTQLEYQVVTVDGETLVCATALKAKIPQLESATVLKTLTGLEFSAGVEYQHPFLERKGKIYPADFVTADAGTGLVHIAPGHGSDDYFLGMQHGLKPFSPVDDRGCLTTEAGVPELTGQYVFKANPLVINLLKTKNALWAVEDYVHDYPHCWRSKTPIVFRSVKQWFIKVDAFRQQALGAIKNEVTWIPSWGESRISAAIANRPDWCISRQRSWGVPIPVFYDENDQPIMTEELILKFADIVEKEGTDAWFKTDTDALASRLGLPAGLRKGRDTLDVWIDSGSSQMAVLKKKGLFPADLYLEGSDQHRGWFNSSLSLSMMVNEVAPYRAVLTHGFIVDEHGKKYSKSSGATDSTTLLNEYGADVLRLWVSSQDYTNDVPFSKNIVSRVADSYRGIRNTLRILLGNLHGFDLDRDALPQAEWTEIDRYIYGQLQEVITTCRQAYDQYEFHQVYQTINRFCTVELSSLYVDVLKDRMYCDGAESTTRRSAQTVMYQIAVSLTQLLAPIIPFTAEETWGFLGRAGSVHLQLLPEPQAQDQALKVRWEKILALRSKVNEQLEQARQRKEIGKSLEAEVSISGEGWQTHDQLLLEEVFIVSKVRFEKRESSEITVNRATGKKCVRCWKYFDELGSDPEHPELCPRCTEAVTS
ncbi:MAG: isoleucine--tRNA ligase [Blastochloris sp.]|nr:isoleucine--tRNA ligase [Blastochloris sp.]